MCSLNSTLTREKCLSSIKAKQRHPPATSSQLLWGWSTCRSGVWCIFSVQEHCWFSQSPSELQKKIHSWASYLAANTGFVSLSCYPGCSEKWEFGGHNSFHPKAAVQSRLSEISLELGDRDDTWLWGSQQERGSSRTVGLTRAEMSWKQLNLKAGNN